MNPSTEDMLNAIDHVNADTIYILPNNKNIILAANQAQSLTEDNFLEVKGIEKTVKTYARKLAPSMTKAEYYGHLLASRGITKEDLPQIIASVIGTVEKEIDEMLQRL